MLRPGVISTLCFLFSIFLACAPAQADGIGIQSMTIEGGPIRSKHFQSGDEDFRERHTLGVIKVATENYGNWGLYYLGPNSVRDTSVGAGYITDPYVIPIGPTQLELSAALGLVTGYQDYPVPLLAGEARLVLYHAGAWDAGLAMAALPYYARARSSDDDDFGIVATTPFLSIRYNFN